LGVLDVQRVLGVDKCAGAAQRISAMTYVSVVLPDSGPYLDHCRPRGGRQRPGQCQANEPDTTWMSSSPRQHQLHDGAFAELLSICASAAASALAFQNSGSGF
jgi:hypothetical protein